MFGGVYTLSQQNPLTGSRTCPPYFYSLRFGEDIWVCVSDPAVLMVIHWYLPKDNSRRVYILIVVVNTTINS